MKTISYTCVLLLLSAALPAQKLTVKETHRFRFSFGGTTEGRISAGEAASASSVALDPSGRFLAVCARGRVTAIDLVTRRRRDLGPGEAVSSGWRTAEILLVKGDEVLRVSAANSERSHLCTLKGSDRPYYDAMVLISSPTREQILYSREFCEQACLYIWEPALHEKRLTWMGADKNASWSKDGTILVTVGTGVRKTEKSPKKGMAKPELWLSMASAYPHRIGGTLTGHISPSTYRVTWGGRTGVVNYTRSEKGPARYDGKKGSYLAWLRYLDEEHFLSHDGQVLTLWRAKDLEPVSSANPCEVPEKLRRKKNQVYADAFPMGSGVGVPWVDPTPIFIHKAILSRDNKRLVLVGKRNVRVFDLSIK